LSDSRSATAALAGRGIALVTGISSPELRDADNREITWKLVRDGRDSLGHRHVFYRQYLNTSANGPVVLFGSEVGVHYGNGDIFARVAGRQFIAVSVANTISFPAGEAQRRAIARLASSPVFRPAAYDSLPMGVRLYRDSHSTLALFTHDGTSFRYVYRTVVGDVTGATFDVILDAGREDVIATERADNNSNCGPTQPVQTSYAQGKSVRPDFAVRSLEVNYAPDRPRGLVYEGLLSGSPRKLVFQETTPTTDLSDFACDPSLHQYTLFPVAAATTPTYMDFSDSRGDWGGNAAGDALYRTAQTMNAFASMGRNGWDGMGSDAQIVVRSTRAEDACGGHIDSCGNFWITTGADTRIPAGGTVLISRETQLYNFAASLDQVAHEWGHGVIATSSPDNFSMSTTPTQLKEGFADVIGQMVEKLTEPAGSGVEQSSDWNLGEDLALNCAPTNTTKCNFYSGTDDDGPAGKSFGAWTASTLNDRLHKDDDPQHILGPVTDHSWGNMLNVTYRLLSDGGHNKICDRLSLSGCGVDMNGLGITSASQIMFDTVQWYLPSNTEWVDLAGYASDAAFDRFNQCSPGLPGRNALIQQIAVNSAFGAIGYPRTHPADPCP
jgi:hypothetical protein